MASWLCLLPLHAQTVPIAVDFAICAAQSRALGEGFEKLGKPETATLLKVRARTLLNWAHELDRLGNVPQSKTVNTYEDTLAKLRLLSTSNEGMLALSESSKEICPRVLEFARKMLPHMAPDSKLQSNGK